MIGLGAQYLTAAGFGRYRITAASLGNLDLLGTFGWLTQATQQAILGAFGDDGYAVIKATNAYLNGIAASDRDKATALAGFINEDPMMVCSLGLEPQGVTMPRRFIVNSETSYLDTGYDTNANTKWKLGFYIDNYTQNARHGESTSNARFYIGTNNGSFIAGYGSNYNHGVKTADGNVHDAELYNAVLTFDGTNYGAGSAFTSSMRMWLFNSNGYDSKVRGGVDYSIFEENGAEIKHFIPFQNGEDAEMLDLVASLTAGTKVFAERHGSFTIPDIVYPTP